MKTWSYITICGIFMLTGAGMSTLANASSASADRQPAGHVMDVVIATAPRPVDFAEVMAETGSPNHDALREKAAEAASDAVSTAQITLAIDPA